MANDFYKAPTQDEISQRYFAPQPAADTTAPAQPQEKPGFFSSLGQNVVDDVTQHGLTPGALAAPLVKSVAQKLTFQPTADQPLSFLKKVSNDAVALGAGIPIALAHPIDTFKSMFTTKENPIGGATAESIKNVFQPDYYKEHPLLGAFNTGTWIATVFTLGASKVVGGVVERGAAEVAAQAGEEVGLASAKTAAESALSKGLLRTATNEALKTGDLSVITQTAKNALIKSGFTEEQATKYATSVTDSIGKGLEENSTKLGIYNKLGHPVDALAEAGGKVLSPVAKAVFGEPDKSAVARLYGNDVVAKDPQGFANIEDWASKQAIERGWKDTVDNRQSIMNEWASTVGEWSLLTPEQKVAYHQNYIQATDYAQQVSDKTGDLVVPTKFLAPKDINAMIDTINSAPVAESPMQILDALENIYGKDIGIHKESLLKMIEANPTKESLVAGIESLGKRYTLSYSRLPEVNQLVQDMERVTGYKLIEAPKGKPISFATKVAEVLPDGITNPENPESQVGKFTSSLTDAQSRLIAAKTKLGTLMDKFGLSTQGGVEGTLENLYADEFTQNITKDLGEQYPNGIKLKVTNLHTGEVAGYRTVPLDRLYAFLDRNKNLIQESAPKLIETRYTVSDISARDLEVLGVDKSVANQIVATARKSLVGLPFAQTGLMEGLVNLARAKIPGFNKFVNLKFETHFNLNPFYAMRYWFKTEILKSMNLTEPHVSFGRVIDERLQPLVQKLPYLKDIIAPQVSLPDIKLMADEVLYDLNKNIVDFASNPELITLEKSAGIAKSIQSRNIFLRAVGYNIPYDATAFAKGIADKYGMTLQDALSYTVENGMKKYNNPSIFNDIRNSVQSVFHYEPGVLTSPLMKSLNTIWFPARFETKVMIQTSRWLGSLSPISRLEVMNNWIHVANWAQTPEGVAWRKKSQSQWETILSYLLPYKEVGDTVGSVLEGQLFNGKTGMIGGLPFGFVINTLQDLSIIPGEESTNPLTGATPPKRTSKKIVSKASAVIAVEDFLSQILPSLPLYTWFGGTVTPFRNTIQNVTEGALSTGEALVTGQDTKKIKKNLDKSFKTVKQGYTRY